MSDYDEFKRVINGFEKELKPECEDVFLVHSTFRDIRDMVELMIQNRDKRIKELESKPKSSPKTPVSSVEKPQVEKPEKECPPGKILNPKTGRCINKPKEKTHKRRGRPKKFDKPEESEEPKLTEKPQKESLNKSMDTQNAEFVKAWLKAKNGESGTLLKLINSIKEKFNATHQYGNDGEITFMKYGVKLDKSESEKIQKYVIDSVNQKDVKPEKECPPGKILNPKTGRCINKPKEKTQKRRGRPKKSVVAEQEQMPSPKPMPSPKQEKSMSFNEALEYIRTTGKPGSYRKFLNDIKNKFGITLKYDNHGDDYAEPTLYFMKGKKEASIEEMKKVQQYIIDTAEKSKSKNKYFDIQYKKFLKNTDKDNLKEAFVEKSEPEPELPPRRNPPRGFFSTTVSGPRTRKKPQYFS